MNRSQKTHTSNVLLYRIVYGSRTVIALSFMLFLSIMLPPLEQAYASESVPETESGAPISIPEPVVPPADFGEPVIITAEDATSEQVADEVFVDTSSEEGGMPESVEDEQTAPETVDSETPTEASVEENVDTPLPPDEVIEETDTPPETPITDDEEVEQTVLETDEAPSVGEESMVDTPQEVGSTTVPEAPSEEVHINDSNRFQFSTKECVSVGDGAFYCSQPETEETEATSAVYAAPDEDGDMEIFVRVSGEEVKITDNIFDDAAPFFAEAENRVVWHSLINDRYQIMSYDIDTNRTSQLTDSPFNNMEPIMVGDMILWQAWIQDNWEIVMYDNYDITQLTNNDVHDVAPSIKDNYVMWQTQFPEGWKVAVYNLETKTADYVDVENLSGALENPRLVLLLDHVDENGNRQMIGYDMETKQPIALGAIPAPLPDELPEPDQTGEERALVQVKPTLKEGEESALDSDDDLGNSSFNPNPDLSTAAGTTPTTIASTTDIVIPPYVAATNTPVVITETLVDPVVVLPTDVVIPPFSSSTDSSIE